MGIGHGSMFNMYGSMFNPQPSTVAGQRRQETRGERAPRDQRSTCNIDDIQKVIWATYGLNRDKDVTDIVKSIVHRNGGTLKLDNVNDTLNEIFGDPNPTYPKKLIVDYIEGRRTSVTIPEYRGSDIPGIGEVLFASYGDQYQRPDVTNQVRSILREGTLPLAGCYKHGPDSMNNHFDDPVPGVEKELIVDYIPAESVTIGEYGGYDIPDVKKVISATYGAGNKRICVTYPVRSMLRGGTLRLAGFRKNAPDSMNNHFTDPVPFIEKELKILYILGGRRRLAANCAEMELRNVISTYKNLHATREKSARRTRNIHR